MNRNSLLIVEPREEDSGQYSCHRENQYGEAWKNYTLTVKNGKHKTTGIMVILYNGGGLDLL